MTSRRLKLEREGRADLSRRRFGAFAITVLATSLAEGQTKTTTTTTTTSSDEETTTVEQTTTTTTSSTSVVHSPHPLSPAGVGGVARRTARRTTRRLNR